MMSQPIKSIVNSSVFNKMYDENRIENIYDDGYAEWIKSNESTNEPQENLFNGTNPSGFDEVKSITYDTNWWGFELGKTSDNMICLGHIQNTIDEPGVNNGGTVSITVSEHGSNTFDYYSEQSVRTGFTIKKKWLLLCYGCITIKWFH